MDRPWFFRRCRYTMRLYFYHRTLHRNVYAPSPTNLFPWPANLWA